MTPTPELLRATLTKWPIEHGHKLLVEQGYQVSRRDCQRVRKQLVTAGIVKMGWKRKWTPEKIEQVHAMLADGKTAGEIAKHMGVGATSVYDLFYRLKLAQGAKPKRPVPSREELEAVYMSNTLSSTADHFGVHTGTVTRWAMHYGMTRPKVEPKPKVSRVYKSRSKRQWNTVWKPADLPAIEPGPAADAATYLRQQGYTNVYRRGPKEWWVGRGPMAEVDMIARAEEVRARKERMRA